MNQQVWHHRDRLQRMKEGLERGALTVGFIGGSITDARPGHNWPESVMSWLVETYPDVRFSVENAGIGATGSDLGVFRAERDLIERRCDVVFIEYAVNDFGTPSERRKRTREGLIRKLLANGKADLIFTYTFMQNMYQDMINGSVPDSILEFEQLADHYGIGSVWMGLYAMEEVRKGRLKWEEWLPDGLHPTQRGSYSYGQSVIAFLKEELNFDLSERSSKRASTPNSDRDSKRFSEAAMDANLKQSLLLPEPINALHWGNVSSVPFSDVQLDGPWTIQRSSQLVWMDQMLVTSAVGAKLKFAFQGRGVTLGFDFGKTSSEFRYRLDGGELIHVIRDRPDWCPNEGWFRLETIADELPSGKHEMEIEVIHGDLPGCTGTHFKLAFIGVIE